MSVGSKDKIANLQLRAHYLNVARVFFSKHNYLEVDTSILSSYATIDPNIDIMSVDCGNQQVGYLHTSPEYRMKEILCMGMGNIYQICHVFRKEEKGAIHNPEFTMAEWYCLDIDLGHFIEQTLDFLSLFFPGVPFQKLSYHQLFKNHGVSKITRQALIEASCQKGLSPDPSWDHTTLLDYFFSHIIEPTLGSDHLFVLEDFPEDQALLSRVKEKNGQMVASRFEIYYQGVELANGYHELQDPKEHRVRFLQAQKELGKNYPIDENFLQALEHGLPNCCGVSVGFDRLLQLIKGKCPIDEVLFV